MVSSIKIGNVRLKNHLVLAPLLGVNCLAFRLLCHKYGAGLVYSPMIHSISLVKNHALHEKIVDFVDEERPVACQLIGNDAKVMVESLEFVEKKCDIIDLNFGCPDPDIVEQKLGAYFSKHPDVAAKIVNKVVSASKNPVTAKIRLGWDDRSKNYLKFAKILEDSGVSAIALHARTKKQMYAGKADWSAIKELKEKVDIPVIGNGDVWKGEDAKLMIEQTGCDFVMIGRGAITNPFIFKQCMEFSKDGKTTPNQSYEEKGRMILDFLKIYNKVQKVKSLAQMKQHSVWMCSGLEGAAKKRNLINRAKDEKELVSTIKSEFGLE